MDMTGVYGYVMIYQYTMMIDDVLQVYVRIKRNIMKYQDMYKDVPRSLQTSTTKKIKVSPSRAMVSTSATGSCS